MSQNLEHNLQNALLLISDYLFCYRAEEHLPNTMRQALICKVILSTFFYLVFYNPYPWHFINILVVMLCTSTPGFYISETPPCSPLDGGSHEANPPGDAPLLLPRHGTRLGTDSPHRRPQPLHPLWRATSSSLPNHRQNAGGRGAPPARQRCGCSPPPNLRRLERR